MHCVVLGRGAAHGLLFIAVVLSSINHDVASIDIPNHIFRSAGGASGLFRGGTGGLVIRIVIIFATTVSFLGFSNATTWLGLWLWLDVDKGGVLVTLEKAIGELVLIYHLVVCYHADLAALTLASLPHDLTADIDGMLLLIVDPTIIDDALWIVSSWTMPRTSTVSGASDLQ